MAASKDTTTYDQVVRITHVYLGPAAKRFIDRQMENHLHKSPPNLSKADLATLVDWIKVAVSLLTEDADIVDEYISELRKLANGNSKSQKVGKLDA